MSDSRLRLLLDRMEISDTVIRYATGIDMRDWEAYRACFTDEVYVDFSSWSGGEARQLKADEWVRRVREGLEGFSATHHMSSNHVITVQGDEARCVSYMQAQHVLLSAGEGNTCTLGGYYTNHLVRTAGGWKICRCKLTVTWKAGNVGLFDLAKGSGG